MPIKKYFEQRPDQPLTPDMRRWSLALAKAEEHHLDVACQLFRPRDGLVFKPARLFLFLRSGGNDVEVLEAPWDPDLNDWLIRQKVRAESLAAEGERFGFAGKDHFSPIEIRFGDGFFNAVMVHHLRAVGFDDVSPSRETLRELSEPHPATGESATTCAEMIDQVIATTAATLTGQLGYSEEEAGAVLAAAIAYYLDERFNVTNSKLLGFR